MRIKETLKNWFSIVKVPFLFALVFNILIFVGIVYFKFPYYRYFEWFFFFIHLLFVSYVAYKATKTGFKTLETGILCASFYFFSGSGLLFFDFLTYYPFINVFFSAVLKIVYLGGLADIDTVIFVIISAVNFLISCFVNYAKIIFLSTGFIMILGLILNKIFQKIEFK